ncbi:MAG: TRL domain-containing protein [Candidatus Sumerlaeia bacterium]|nr:TRL domain-containing protein [Candidatus Sumerlaeia bacterium]
MKAPLTTNYNATPVGDAAPKHASLETGYFRDPLLTGLSFAWDDVAIQKIAKEGGIDEVAYADYEGFLILGVFGKFTIHVYGN